MAFEVPATANGFQSPAAQAAGRRAGALARRWLPTSRRSLFFFIAVVAPTLFATLYYGLIASNRFVSESEFVVRSVSSHRATGLEMLFQTFGVSRTEDDGNAVQSYLLSRDAVRALERRIPLRKMFGRDGVDLFARFPHFWRGDSFERLYEYYLERVSVIQDPSKGITVLRVIAFDPSDAQQMTTELLRLGEEMVNRLNSRAQRDAISSSLVEMANAEKRTLEAQIKLREFRNKEGLVDPAKNSSSVLETITTLSTELADDMAQANELKRNSPQSPSIGSANEKIDSLRRGIESQRLQLAGGDASLAAKLGVYEQLALERELAERSLASANLSLEAARQEARRQAIYLESIVSPNLSDESTEPQRLRLIVTVFVLSFALASVAWLVVAGAKEHSIE
ncbi:capsule biosynthesis protein [uncultured Rhodoblastus sp.]|uniref:capsule biosynthesis protein n=1 Tax=uncultured Rhodoblastus sp. TaxID=543037 RepID=UPI0025FBEE6F|nr:capsule biosynthesis protein [uncultured Rhodoblastus sp.]